MSTVQDQVLKYALLVGYQLYSLVTSIIFHLSSFTAVKINEYPQVSLLLTTAFGAVISIYLVKNVVSFAIKSLVKLIKLLFFMTVIVIAIILYFRGLQFFTVDLVQFYQAIVKDVEKGTIYTDKILKNFENIYQETLSNGELLEKSQHVKFLVSKAEQYKKFVSL